MRILVARMLNQQESMETSTKTTIRRLPPLQQDLMLLFLAPLAPPAHQAEAEAERIREKTLRQETEAVCEEEAVHTAVRGSIRQADPEIHRPR